MIDSLVGHHHSGRESPLSRLPAELKLGLALVIVVGTVVVPGRWADWFVAVSLLLGVAVIFSHIPVFFLIKRLAWLSPLILGVAFVNALQPATRGSWLVVAVRSALCLLTVILVSNTTPFSTILRVLQRVRVPSLLVTTIALMHRYLFVLTSETERMARARASRTFVRGRRARWQTLSTVAGRLFVRASERAERIYDAMCARGWR